MWNRYYKTSCCWRGFYKNVSDTDYKSPPRWISKSQNFATISVFSFFSSFYILCFVTHKAFLLSTKHSYFTRYYFATFSGHSEVSYPNGTVLPIFVVRLTFRNTAVLNTTIGSFIFRIFCLFRKV